MMIHGLIFDCDLTQVLLRKSPDYPDPVRVNLSKSMGAGKCSDTTKQQLRPDGSTQKVHRRDFCD